MLRNIADLDVHYEECLQKISTSIVITHKNHTYFELVQNNVEGKLYLHKGAEGAVHVTLQTFDEYLSVLLEHFVSPAKP